MQATPRRTACWPTCLDRNSVEDALFRCFFLVLCLVLRQAKVVRSAFARIHRLRSKPQRHLAHITEILPRNKFGRWSWWHQTQVCRSESSACCRSHELAYVRLCLPSNRNGCTAHLDGTCTVCYKLNCEQLSFLSSWPRWLNKSVVSVRSARWKEKVLLQICTTCPDKLKSKHRRLRMCTC